MDRNDFYKLVDEHALIWRDQRINSNLDLCDVELTPLNIFQSDFILVKPPVQTCEESGCTNVVSGQVTTYELKDSGMWRKSCNTCKRKSTVSSPLETENINTK